MADIFSCRYEKPSGIVWTPIRYVALHFWDRREAASLRYRNGAEITRSYVWTKSLSGMVFVAVQKLSMDSLRVASPQTSFGVRSSRNHFSPLWHLFNSVLITNFLAHPIKSLSDRANLNKRLGLRFTKILKRPVIGERKCRVCLADVRGGEMIAWRTNPKGRLRGG